MPVSGHLRPRSTQCHLTVAKAGVCEAIHLDVELQVSLELDEVTKTGTAGTQHNGVYTISGIHPIGADEHVREMKSDMVPTGRNSPYMWRRGAG